jgi:hypothetical protein
MSHGDRDNARALGQDLHLARIIGRVRAQCLERRFATYVMEVYEQEGRGNGPEIGDPNVERLVEDHVGLPIGECSRCGKRAPLRDTLMSPKGLGHDLICAWGCDGDIAAQFSDGEEQPQPPPEGTRTHAWIGPGGIVRNGQWVSVVCDVPPPPPQPERPRNTLPYGSLR